ncbi:MAG: hypothetical protein KJ057_16735 [Phycisphaerae bacterium]|nr:MAG: hypothetical protein EDS66_14080 [Planctomycetota bacterium]MBE7457351.1 hypothetical protein [Planctomycetia bacterium]MCL4720114.1 hypothetical protein [Phycisphaerae bacterium]
MPDINTAQLVRFLKFQVELMADLVIARNEDLPTKAELQKTLRHLARRDDPEWMRELDGIVIDLLCGEIVEEVAAVRCQDLLERFPEMTQYFENPGTSFRAKTRHSRPKKGRGR